MAKWLLDPGHGGTDSGATYKGRRECEDVLRLTLRVGEILKNNGIDVTVRREMGADINAACGQLRKSYIESAK